MPEFVWLSMFVATGLIVGLAAAVIPRFAGIHRMEMSGAHKRLFSSITLLLLIAAGWSIVNTFNVPARTVLMGKQELRGVSGPLTADTNPEDSTFFVQSHSIRIDPGRIDQPVTITYTWGPPRAVVTYPKEAAAFLTGVGSKDMKITGMPPCPETVKGRISEVPSCAHRDSMGKFVFGWALSGISDSQTVKAMVRLGATAVNGTFETQVCRRVADTSLCNEKNTVASFSAAGAGNGTSVLYGDEKVEVHTGDSATSKDGAVTVDGANGTLALTTVVKDSIHLTRQQATLLGFLGTVLGALLGNGILLAVLSLWKPAPTASPQVKVRVPPLSPRPRR
jgi:hypothetical protein